MRNNFGFKGVTITDGMNMQAISANYSFEDGITLAVNAGNDIILYTGTLRYGSSLAQQVINVINNKVNDGTIPLSRIEESYNRILELKKKFKIITSIENIAKETPPDFILYQNYPNPFNSSTTIVFNLPARQNVSVIIYNQLGEKIKEILNNEELPVGENKIVWNGLNDDNKPVSSGVYFYRISSGRNALYGKMILQK